MAPDTTKPASGLSAEPVSESEFLPGSKLSSNTPNASTSQAPCPADDAGEDDWQYFGRRPHVSTRTRFALPAEFPDDFLEHGGAVAVVRVAVTRDGRGQPVWAARSVLFRSGGSA